LTDSFASGFKIKMFKLLLLVQEGRRKKAGGRRKESLYSKLFKLFQLDSYFRHAALEP
jgi:hypothetical protein